MFEYVCVVRFRVVFLLFVVLGCGSSESLNDVGVDVTIDVVPKDVQGDVVDVIVDVVDVFADVLFDASVDVGIDGNPVLVMCAVAIVFDVSIVYMGITCDGIDSIMILCNVGAHKEVYVRIDGMIGQVWSVKV